MKRSLAGVVAIAATTFASVVRSRVLLAAAITGSASLLAALLVASGSVREQGRFIVDMGLGAASALGSVLAISLTVSVVGGEIRRNVVYTVLVRPVPRAVFLLGKYVGLVATLNVVVAVLLGVTAGAIALLGAPIPAAFWPSVVLAWLEMGVVASIALLFAANSSAAVASVLTIGTVIGGNFAHDMLELSEYMFRRGGVLSSSILRAAHYILPDIQILSLRVQAANQLPVPGGFVATATLYACFYIAAVLVVACLIFGRRRAF